MTGVAIVGMATAGLPDGWPPELDAPQAELLQGHGTGSLDRDSLLFASAGVCAARSAGVTGAKSVGVVCGTSTAGESSYRRILAALAEPSCAIRPTWGPRASFNAPAAELSMRTDATGPALTVTSSGVAGLDAVLVARDLIVCGRARVVLAGGIDAFAGDADEGAAVLVLVDASDDCSPAARLEGVATCVTHASESPGASARAVARAIRDALAESGRSVAEVATVITARGRDRAGRGQLDAGLRDTVGLGAHRIALEQLPGPGRCCAGALGALAGAQAADRGVSLVVALAGDGAATVLVIARS